VRHSPYSFAAALGIATLHTGITLWYRLPILLAAGAMKASDVTELNRMVGEKAAAATLGMIEGQKEIMRLSGAAMTGRLRLNDGSAVAHASLRPALRTVKRNASRLRRRRRRGKGHEHA
jgi:hypothetical protein